MNALEIMDESRGTYLNDPTAGTYTNDKLLPLLKSAYKFLQSGLEENGVQSKNEEELKIIEVGETEYAPLPNDLVIPRRLMDRDADSDDDFRPIDYKHTLPTEKSGPIIHYWTYRVDRIFFRAATTRREVKLIYQKSFPGINDPASNLAAMSDQYLPAKLGALAHMFLAQNYELAKVCNDQAEMELQSIINLYTKLQQSSPSRRKPYIPHRI